ncbi:FMN-binding protein [Ktedonobacteria bacterium brp13]|nr:FMN-binding protein [Ktedonobacteria bacterium brp13]
MLYSFLYRSSTVALLPTNSTDAGSSKSVSSTNSASSTPNTAGTSGSGSYKDGSYTGSVADAFYGNIQVKAIIQNGKIKDVQFLQYPNDRDRSIMINSYADPQLTTEAIQAQNANVSIVTGATDTSDAFIQSLTNALSQAKA